MLSPVHRIDDAVLRGAGIELYLKRDDLIEGRVSGNKWRKLRLNLDEVMRRNIDTVVTFGGAYSNHIRAVAAAGKTYGMSTVGVIRGEPYEPLNWSLRRAVDDGMRLTYLDRSTYRQKDSADVASMLLDKFGEHYLLPEGGSNHWGVRGCVDLGTELATQVESDVVCCAVGTGGTVAGLAAGIPDCSIVGFSVMRGGDYLVDEIAAMQIESFGSRVGRWEINPDFHHGGFAKRGNELNTFITWFWRTHRIRLEWVYVAKMLSGVYTLARDGFWSRGTRVVAVVTGAADEPESMADDRSWPAAGEC